MKKLSVTLILFVIFLNAGTIGCNSKGSIGSGITKLKKDISPQLVSAENKRILEAPMTMSSARASAFMLLASYDGVNRKLYLGRLHSLSKEVIDQWKSEVSKKTNEDIETSVIGQRFPHIEFLFNDSTFNKSASEKYLQRIHNLPDDILNDWNKSLTPFDDGDDYPAANTLLIIIGRDEFFDDVTPKKDVLQKTLVRLKGLQPGSMERLADILQTKNRKLFSTCIAAQEAFFDKDTFAESGVEQALKESK